MSEQSLTGYDNVDASQRRRPDEEVFLYDASTGRLVCASCNPTARRSLNAAWGVRHQAPRGRPRAARRPSGNLGEPLARRVAPGLDVQLTGGGPVCAYQPRYLSNSGRLFFDSPDALVPAATNGKEDVYEYEPDGVGSCQSSSRLRRADLLGHLQRGIGVPGRQRKRRRRILPDRRAARRADTNQAFDIYDAHVCSETSPCLPSPSASTQECESSGTCRPAPRHRRRSRLPASATYSGPGNVANAPSPPAKTHPKAQTR